MLELKKQLSQELENILTFWENNTVDIKNGGFIGKMNHQGQIDPNAIKGGVLNARILWTFSEAYHFTHEPRYLTLAQRAFDYLKNYFWDTQHGGVYWAVDALGNPSSTRKQIYGQAFAMYAFASFYKATQHQESLNLAIALFEIIEKYSFDTVNGGYWEAFSQDWQLLTDLRLSEKDRNDPKTMNTHLHIIEAYASLYLVWKDTRLASKLEHLLEIFNKHFINPKGHLNLFFDAEWHIQSSAISFGHDIEAAWLLQESAEILGKQKWIDIFQEKAILMANTSLRAIQSDGSLIHEYDLLSHHVDMHREWWVSAEAMVGFYNAFQLTKHAQFLDAVKNTWTFIQTNLIDTQQGEWVWGRYEDGSLMETEDKVGFWKCPYHNARACMELIKRITAE